MRRATAGLLTVVLAGCTTTRPDETGSTPAVVAVHTAPRTSINCLPITVTAGTRSSTITTASGVPTLSVAIGDHVVAHVRSRCAAIVHASTHGRPGNLIAAGNGQWTVRRAGRTELTFTAAMCQLIDPVPSGCAGGVAVVGDLVVVARPGRR